MQLHLSCGALGIQANQRQAVDFAAKHGFDVIDADGKYLQGLSDGETQDLLGYMRSKKVGWALAGLPVDFRGEDAAFEDGMSRFPAFVAGLRRAGVRRLTTYILRSSDPRTYRVNFKLHANRLREVAGCSTVATAFGLEYVAPKTLWAAS